MIAIEIELLTGRYVATEFNDRRKPEWPPHPARLFSALVATACEQEELSGNLRAALEWLEQQGDPDVLASDAKPRMAVTTYVPENTTRVLADCSRADQDLQKALQAVAEAEQSGNAKGIRRARGAADRAQRKLDEQVTKAITDDGKFNASACAHAQEMLPDHRGKQPRTLPSMTPFEPRIRYVWPEAKPDGRIHRSLSALARNMVRLGHSSSLVACRVVDSDRELNPSDGLHTWQPTGDGSAQQFTGDESVVLRTVGPGQLGRLESAYARHQGVDPRILPALHQRYGRQDRAAAAEPARSVFGEWLVLREVATEGGSRVGLRLTRTEDLTRALRSAILHHADDPPPGVLSGHSPGGRPLDRPHVAFLALGDVGWDYASGAVLGAAILMPRDVDSSDRRAILRAIGRWESQGLRLVLGRAGALQLERILDGDPRRTLQSSSWTRASDRWASVTPVALDQNPGNLSARNPVVAANAAARAEQIVARSCEHVGLPSPAWVQVMPRSLCAAAPDARRFMPYPRNGRGFRRVCVHVELQFNEPVVGPVVLGAGRYFGLGLCRPQWDTSPEQPS